MDKVFLAIELDIYEPFSDSYERSLFSAKAHAFATPEARQKFADDWVTNISLIAHIEDQESDPYFFRGIDPSQTYKLEFNEVPILK